MRNYCDLRYCIFNTMCLPLALPTCKAGGFNLWSGVVLYLFHWVGYSWGLVCGFFVHPVMLTVTILYCPSPNPHLIIFLHLWAQAFTLYIWFSSQYLFTPEGTMDQPAYPLSSQWESLNAMVTWNSLLFSLPWGVARDLNTVISILEDSRDTSYFFSVKSGFFRVCCAFLFTQPLFSSMMSQWMSSQASLGNYAGCEWLLLLHNPSRGVCP